MLSVNLQVQTQRLILIQSDNQFLFRRTDFCQRNTTVSLWNNSV